MKKCWLTATNSDTHRGLGGSFHGLCHPSPHLSWVHPIFISSFWRELFKMSGTTLHMSTGCHPQMDGQTEVMNRTLEQYLRSFVHHQPAAWYKFLALAEWSYNTSQHTGTGMTPYEVVYNKPPPPFPATYEGRPATTRLIRYLAHERKFT